MDRDREENTRLVSGFVKYGRNSAPLSSRVREAPRLRTCKIQAIDLLVVSGLVKCDTNPIVGVPQVAELGDLPKEVTDKSIRPTQEFEGQNKSIKSRVRLTLMICDTFAVDKVVDADVVSFLEA
ncbi:hypothetical protein ACFX15_040110 [Malus domestica]